MFHLSFLMVDKAIPHSSFLNINTFVLLQVLMVEMGQQDNQVRQVHEVRVVTTFPLNTRTLE